MIYKTKADFNKFIQNINLVFNKQVPGYISMLKINQMSGIVKDDIIGKKLSIKCLKLDIFTSTFFVIDLMESNFNIVISQC